MALRYQVEFSKLGDNVRGDVLEPSYFGDVNEPKVAANIERLLKLGAMIEVDVETPEEAEAAQVKQAAEDEQAEATAPDGLKGLDISALQGIAAELGIVNFPKTKAGLIKAIEAEQGKAAA